MRILFFISAVGHGKGGHSNSLNVISREIAKYDEVQICGVGPGRTLILETNPFFNKIIYTNGIPDLKFLKELKAVINEFRPDVVHCFDEKVYLVMSYALTVLRKKLPMVLNKCGGPNIADFPVAKHLVLFSTENLEYYQSNKQFSKTNFSLIPNRAVADLETRTTHVFDDTEGKIRIFRIGRIGRSYKKTAHLALDLARALVQRGVGNFHLYLIGTVDDDTVRHDLEEQVKGLPVSIVSDHDITVKASAFLHYSDIAICTGRGLMEACSFGIPVLAGSIQSKIPVPVNAENFETFFHYNFSERANVNAGDEATILSEIEGLIQSPEKRREASVMSLHFFNSYFNVLGAAEKYRQVYQNALNSPATYFLSKNGITLLKALRYYYTSSLSFKKKLAMETAKLNPQVD